MTSRLLEGKTAVVTGASKGIGKAIAELFAAEGASVVLTARGQEALDETVNAITGKGGKAMGLAVDMAQESSVEAAVKAAVDHFGRSGGPTSRGAPEAVVSLNV